MRRLETGMRRGILLIVLLVLGTGYADDVRSCQRQQPIRRESNRRASALRDFMLDASATRAHQAAIERTRDPDAAALDQAASIRYRADAMRVGQVGVPSCFPQPGR